MKHKKGYVRQLKHKQGRMSYQPAAPVGLPRVSAPPPPPGGKVKMDLFKVVNDKDCLEAMRVAAPVALFMPPDPPKAPPKETLFQGKGKAKVSWMKVEGLVCVIFALLSGAGVVALLAAMGVRSWVILLVGGLLAAVGGLFAYSMMAVSGTSSE